MGKFFVLRILSVISSLIGIFFLINSNMNLTGAVIGAPFSFGLNSILVFVFIIASMSLFLFAEYRESDLVESVREATKGIYPVPKEEAIKIYKEANEKVGAGEWVELMKENITPSSNPDKWPDSTSLCRYWGSKEYIGRPREALKKLYKKGKIGKTHELLVGSDVYRPPKYEGGEKEATMPPAGSRVLHRHWEIKKMHEYGQGGK